ncbi:MAG TPA: HPF/RaiA family ribosome-associated protein [Burkholderiaceae bacterium]|nr:HPF/RaiA family ribosome-associated protein [Burkholderiaceae bacterium]
MKLPLEIHFRDMVPLPSLEPEIRRRAAKLEQWGTELMSCQVTVDASANRRRQGHEYQVHIDVRVPGDQVVINQHHRGDDAQLAVRGAFDAMDRLLRERIERRREPMPPD